MLATANMAATMKATAQEILANIPFTTMHSQFRPRHELNVDAATPRGQR